MQTPGTAHSAQCAFWVVRWPCSQNGPVSDTIKNEGVDTGAYVGKNGWIRGHILGGNHGSRVWNSRFPHVSCFSFQPNK